MCSLDWYLAKLVYKIDRPAQNRPAEFDVQLRLIRADEKDWAIEKATTIGRLEETVVTDTHNRTVEWKFIGVTEIIEIGELEDTSLIYSQSEEPTNETEYKVSLKSKMALLNQHILVGTEKL
jgi:hypothetical protein